jgi:enterochelin esterase-like enzyme
MWRLFSGALALLAMVGSARADSVLVSGKVPSSTLERPFPYMAYLPDGYERGDKRYPVVYLLHGAGGDEASWVNDGHAKVTVDRLIATGAIPPTLVVMPGCRGCWWVDGPLEKAESAFWQDLVPEVGRRYRIVEGRRGRLLAGLSAGGYGAVRYAMRYPDQVAAVAALSPAIYADAPPAISSARSQPPFRRLDGSFDEAAWKSKNYPACIEDYFKQPERVAFYLMSGDDDRYGIAFETMTLYRRLKERQPGMAELRIVDGDHSWSVWALALENAMRFLLHHSDGPQPSTVAAERPFESVASVPAIIAQKVTTGRPGAGLPF